MNKMRAKRMTSEYRTHLLSYCFHLLEIDPFEFFVFVDYDLAFLVTDCNWNDFVFEYAFLKETNIRQIRLKKKTKRFANLPGFDCSFVGSFCISILFFTTQTFCLGSFIRTCTLSRSLFFQKISQKLCIYHHHLIVNIYETIFSDTIFHMNASIGNFT
jgi:hypothetical protein